MKVFQIVLLLLVVGCSSESDKIVPDDPVKKSTLEPQIKSVEPVTIEPQVKQLEKATEVNTPVIKSTNNLRKKAEKRTNSRLVKDSVKIVPWDLDSGQNWDKQNDPEFVEDPRVVIPWEE